MAFGVLAVVAAAVTAGFGFGSADATGEGGESAQVLSGIAFGVALAAGVVAILAIHAYAE
jgi:hypothetical protein